MSSTKATNTFRIHDSSLHVWFENVDDQVRELYDDIRVAMMNDKWTFHQDPETKKHYPLISDNHHSGQRKEIKFKSSIHGRHIEFRFFDEAIGQYDFQTMSNLSYVHRLAVQLQIGKLCAILIARGLCDDTRRNPEEAELFVAMRRHELRQFQGEGFYDRQWPSYNTQDGNGVTMTDGDVRYFWDRSGHIQRGLAYRNINNMWWVITGPYSHNNIAAFDLFQWRPSMGRKRVLPPAKIEAKLKSALEPSETKS